MTFRKDGLELEQPAAQVLGSIAVVMEVDFHFTEAATTELGNRVDVLGDVFVDGVEERVAWGSAIAVAEVPQTLGVLFDPAIGPGLCNGSGRVSPARFVMIGNTEQEVRGLGGSARTAPAGVDGVTEDPAIQRTAAKCVKCEQEEHADEQ
jgi:hypothetical protein